MDKQEMARAVADEMLKREALATLLAAAVVLLVWWLSGRAQKKG